MSERHSAERIIGELHAARLAGDLSGMLALFADEGQFVIAGASADKPISIRAAALAEFRPWLAMMTKVFRLSRYERRAIILEWPRASVNWRVDILSKVTGVTVRTELIDLLELRDGKIVSYTEFFVPC